MKVPVGNFTTDMNNLLNQLNSKNNLLSQLNTKNGLANANVAIQKAWNNTEQKYNQATQNINNVNNQYHADLRNSEQTMNESFSEKLKNKSDEFLNKLLQQENNFKDFQGKDAAQKLQLANKIDTAHNNIISFVNGQHFETPQDLNRNYDQLWGNITFRGHIIRGPKDMANAIWTEDHYIAQQMATQTQEQHQFVTDEINNTISGPIQQQFTSMQTQMPHNFMKFVQAGEPMPDGTPGDICWVASDIGFHSNAQAYEYEAGAGWQPMKTQMNLFASNIYSPNINGGVITGAQFLSEEHGRDGQAVFSVDPRGNIYANNLQMDLDTVGTGSGLNGYTYNADNNDAKGLSFAGGVMTMKAIANQVSGKFVRGYNGAVGGYNDADYMGDFNAQTYIQPDYIKLRAGTLGDGSVETNQSNGESEQVGALLARTDLRAGNLELADEWNQDYGVRLGYWNNDSSNNPDKSFDVGPLLAIENGVKLGYVGNSNNPEFDLAGWQFEDSGAGKLWIQPYENGASEIELKAPVNIDGMLKVENDTIVKGHHYRQDLSQIRHGFNLDEAQLEHHHQWLQNHDQVLTIGGTINGRSTRLDRDANLLSDQSARISRQQILLRQHTGWLYQHDDLFRKHGQRLDSFDSTLNNQGDILTSQGALIGKDGKRLDHHKYMLGQHGELLNEHGQKLSDHDKKLIEHESELNDHEATLQEHSSHLSTHDTEIASLQQQAAQVQKDSSNWWAAASTNENVYDSIGNLNSFRDQMGQDYDGSIKLEDNRIWATNYGNVYFHDDDDTPIQINVGTIAYYHKKDLSDRSLKTHIHTVNSKDALSKVLNTDIRSYKYKIDSDTEPLKYGPIIDDYNINRNKQDFYTPNEFINYGNNGQYDGIDTDNITAFLILSIQELEKQNSHLTQRVAKLEFKD